MRKLALLMAAVLALELVAPATIYAEQIDADDGIETEVVVEDEILNSEPIEETTIELIEEDDALEDTVSSNELELLASKDLGTCYFKYLNKSYKDIDYGYIASFLMCVPKEKLEKFSKLTKVTYTVDGGSKEYTGDLMCYGSVTTSISAYPYKSSSTDEVVGKCARGNIVLAEGVLSGEHTIRLKLEITDGTDTYTISPEEEMVITFVEPHKDFVFDHVEGSNYISIATSTGVMDLSQAFSISSPVNTKRNNYFRNKKISILKGETLIWTKDIDVEEQALSSFDERYRGLDELPLPDGTKYGALSEISVAPYTSGAAGRIGKYNVLEAVKSGKLRAGEYYDLLIERDDGSTTLEKNAIEITADTRITGFGISNPGCGPYAIPINGSYVSIYVYGLNLNKNVLPVFYGLDEENVAYTDEVKIVGYEPFCMRETYGSKQEGAYYKLSMAPGYDARDLLVDAAYEVKFNNAYVETFISHGDGTGHAEWVENGFRKLYSHPKSTGVLYMEWISIGGQYLRLYLDPQVYTEDGSVTARTFDNSSSEFTTPETADCQIDELGRVYADFSSKTSLYKLMEENGYIEVRAPWSATYDEIDGYAYNQMLKYANNLDVLAGYTWEIHNLTEVGAPIYSGTNTGSSVLSAEQVAELRKIGTVRVNLYENGLIKEHKLLHFLPEGENIELVNITSNEITKGSISTAAYGNGNKLDKAVIKQKEDFTFYVYPFEAEDVPTVKYSVDGGSEITLKVNNRDCNNYKYIIPKSKLTGDIYISVSFSRASGDPEEPDPEEPEDPNAISIDTLDISPIPTTVTWNGGATPVDVVVKTANGTVLELNKDYIVSYYDNTKPGTAKLVIAGVEKYTGTKEYKYTIAKANFATDSVASEEEAKEKGKIYIALKSTEFDYTGSAIKPEIIAKRVGADGELEDLEINSDFTVKYANNTNTSYGKTGTMLPSVTLTGKGIYQGKKVITFAINRADIDNDAITIVAPSVEYKEGTAAKTNPIVTISVNGITKTLKAGKDYEKLTDSSFKNNTSKGKGIVTIEGKGNFRGTKEAEFSIGTLNIVKLATMTLPEEYTGKMPVVFNGVEIRPVPTVTLTDGGSALVENEDYVIDYINCNKAGKATVRVRGIGDYFGSKNLKFKIAARKVSQKDGETEILRGLDISLSMIGLFEEDGNYSADFTGYALKPEIAIVDKNAAGYVLKSGTDYKIKYSNNTNASADGKYAALTITFKGNYSGKYVKNFTIKPWNITDVDTIVAVDNALYKGGKPITTKVTVSRNGILVNPKAVKLTYDRDNSKVVDGKELKVTLSGAKESNIRGSVVKEYSVSAAKMSDATVVKIKDQKYTGSAIKPALKVKYNGVALKEGTDYTVSYRNNKDKGMATAIITAKGDNFTGRRAVTFIIK